MGWSMALSKDFIELFNISTRLIDDDSEAHHNSFKIDEAITKVKSNCTTKFEESIDVSIVLNLKNRKK